MGIFNQFKIEQICANVNGNVVFWKRKYNFIIILLKLFLNSYAFQYSSLIKPADMPTHCFFAHCSSCTLVAKLKGNQSLRAKPLIVCFINSLYAVLLLTW